MQGLLQGIVNIGHALNEGKIRLCVDFQKSRVHCWGTLQRRQFSVNRGEPSFDTHKDLFRLHRDASEASHHVRQGQPFAPAAEIGACLH